MNCRTSIHQKRAAQKIMKNRGGCSWDKLARQKSQSYEYLLRKAVFVTVYTYVWSQTIHHSKIHEPFMHNGQTFEKLLTSSCEDQSGEVSTERVTLCRASTHQLPRCFLEISPNVDSAERNEVLLWQNNKMCP